MSEDRTVRYAEMLEDAAYIEDMYNIIDEAVAPFRPLHIQSNLKQARVALMLIRDLMRTCLNCGPEHWRIPYPKNSIWTIPIDRYVVIEQRKWFRSVYVIHDHEAGVQFPQQIRDIQEALDTTLTMNSIWLINNFNSPEGMDG